MTRLKVGVLEILSASARPDWGQGRNFRRHYASIMPQVVSVWCRQLGHDVTYATYYGQRPPHALLPEKLDVVFLSTTRSSKPSQRRRNRFGFLVLPNRLCVAMSRQRKLLIAVGDAGQMTSPEGRKAVPALSAFRELTGGAHGFRRSA